MIEGHTQAGVEMAVDFGGGTFDVAILDSREGEARVAGTAGVAIGGEILDGVLFETIVGPELGLDGLPSWLFNELRTSSSVRLLMADPGIPNILARIGGTAADVADAILFGGLAYDFYRAIESAKIALSNQESTAIEFGPLGLQVQIRRSAFESMIRPELDQIAATITRALDEARIAGRDVDRVLLTGGSAYIPAFRHDLAARFGEERLEQRDAFTAVVHGLGVRAQQLWARDAVTT